MLRKKQGEIEWLEFEIFQDVPLKHGIFLRSGGVSGAPFYSLNCSTSAGDSLGCVRENFRRILSALELERAVWGLLSHGNDVAIVEDDRTKPFADTLITTKSNLGLMMTHADCQIIILYDPTLHVLASAHVGWRGNVNEVIKNTIQTLKSKFFVKPENLLAGISPSLGPSYSEFINYKKELPESFLNYQIKPLYFDLWAISKSQLLSEGLLAHHIEIANICTYQEKDQFFSYRRDKVTGRNATLAALTPS